MLKPQYLIAYLLLHTPLFANIGPQGFGAFLNPYFVETGTYCGGGIGRAMRDGFKKIRSIEFNQQQCRSTQQYFSRYHNVMIVHGDSSKDLWNLIKDISEPITFWLDAHVYPAFKDSKNCPLIEELEQIKWHPIKTHIILIDDMHCAGKLEFDFLTKEDIIKKILEINPLYRISYVDGGDAGEYKDNVMVAMVP